MKKRFSNHHFLNNAKFIDNAITCEKYHMYPCFGNGYPFVIKSENISQIEGEVYEITSKKTLENIDILENYPDLYLKELIKVKIYNGNIVNTLIYFKNEETYLEEIDKSMPMSKMF
ncbi:gamma-glutamylcyclotransferase [Aliarcobacter butzleri]|uniref:gamma-glutamylcyclotransferase family protein n=1 Tax=Aliarcobacter butzleri TaxID=28197 RepID=UPI00263F12AF|nr:gamma-glutamylcyclotransferase family protein [Aliarcobacter butzleri]MDN5105051.1 gamma-glutamylcyclotransferase [Aliarcobacter butzleri]